MHSNADESFQNTAYDRYGRQNRNKTVTSTGHIEDGHGYRDREFVAAMRDPWLGTDYLGTFEEARHRPGRLDDMARRLERAFFWFAVIEQRQELLQLLQLCTCTVFHAGFDAAAQ